MQPPVQRRFGADDGVAHIVTDQHRVLGVGEVAMANADVDHRRDGRRAGPPTRRASAAEAESAHRALIGKIIGDRQIRHDKAIRLTDAGGDTRSRPARRRGWQLVGLAYGQQFDIAAEDAPVVVVAAQLVMPGIGCIVGRYLGQPAGGPGDGAVALAGADEIEPLAGREEQVVFDHLVVGDGGTLAAGHVDHVFGVGRRAPEQRPGRTGGAQHRLVHRRPGGPEIGLQLLPQRCLVKLSGLGEWQEFDQARETADDVDDAVDTIRDVEQRQFGLGRVEAGQPAHGLVRAEVGRAQHQQAAVGQGRHAPPDLGAGAPIGDHRPHHQTAHRVGDDMDRLAGAFGLGQQGFQSFGEALGGVAHGLPPVVRKDLDPMGACQVFEQRTIEVVEQVHRLHIGGAPPDVLQPTAQ